MDGQERQRPEGERTQGNRASTARQLITQVLSVAVIYVVGLYVFDAAPGPASRLPIAVLLATLAGIALVYAVELITVRALPTMWIGALVTGAWLIWALVGTGFTSGARLVGVVGLIVFAATPRSRLEEASRLRAELHRRHPAYGVWRERLRIAWLAIALACVVGVALAGLLTVASGR